MFLLVFHLLHVCLVCHFTDEFWVVVLIDLVDKIHFQIDPSGLNALKPGQAFEGF